VDIVFLAIVIIASLLLPRNRALLVTPAAWAVCLAFVGWGPAHNSDVHLRSAGCWVPWCIVLVIGLGLTYGITYLRQRREAARA
jgi:hypothetical protein